MQERAITEYSAKVGLNFLEDAYQITLFDNLSDMDRQRVHYINILNDYKEHSVIVIRAVSHVSSLRRFKDILKEFQEYRSQFQISAVTLKGYEKYIGKFLLYLERHEITELSQITAATILDYCRIFATCTKATSHNSMSVLRVFLRYLHQKSVLSEDLSGKVPSANYRRDAHIPSAFPMSDVKRILESVDRGSSIGKRDYAILLLASELGLRAGDIRNLKFSNLHWERNTIELTMNKTGKAVVLPLLESVGMAIVDYLKYGRPKADAEYIFLRQQAPTQKLSAPGMTCIVKRYVYLSGIEVKPRQSTGPHALRHSLASALLEEGVSMPVISEILGHTDSRSTSIYLKIDVKQLKKCALDVPEFSWNAGREVF